MEGNYPACRRSRVGKKSLNYVPVFCTGNPHWQLEMLSFSLICILDCDFSGRDTCGDCPQVKFVDQPFTSSKGSLSLPFLPGLFWDEFYPPKIQVLVES